MGKVITAFLDDAKSYLQLQTQREVILNSILKEEAKFQKLVTGDVPCMHTHQPHAADMCGEGLPACHPQIPSCENWV